MKQILLNSTEEFESEYASYGENYLYESFIFDTVSEYLMEQNKMVITEAVEDEGTEE